MNNSELLTSKNQKVQIFDFAESRTSIRLCSIEGNVWFVAKDVCKALDISNHRDATSRLDDDEVRMSVLPTPSSIQKLTVVSESGLYALIFHSRKDAARNFRKWVTNEVLPSIRKKGFYQVAVQDNVFEDARNIPFTITTCGTAKIRTIAIDSVSWFSMRDLLSAFNSRTDACKMARQLSKRGANLKKIWIVGTAHPGWFLDAPSAKLLQCSCRKVSEFTFSLENQN